VHGWCANADDWTTLRGNIVTYVTDLKPLLYTDGVNYNLYYDGQSVKQWPTGTAVSNIGSGARFFSINFFDDVSLGTNPTQVAQVSILNKADELAQVLQAITALTHVKDVIVIAHSQGGLVARAYVQGLAVPGSTPCTDADHYVACSTADDTLYVQDVAKLITLDTPHGGADVANIVNAIGLNLGACFSTETLNRRELAEGSWLVSTLNTVHVAPPPGLTLASVVSYTTPSLLTPLLTVLESGDGIVTAREQSIQAAVPSVGSSTYYDISDDFATYLGFYGLLSMYYVPLPLLHELARVGTQTLTASSIDYEIAKLLDHGVPAQTTSITVQATLDGNPYTQPVSFQLSEPLGVSGSQPATFYGVPVGTYTLSNVAGGPSTNFTISPSPQQTLGVDHYRGTSVWNLTFTVAFASSASISTNPPTTVSFGNVALSTLTTSALTVQNGGDAALHLTSFNISGSNASSFSLVSPPSLPYTVASGGSTQLNVRFDPPTAGYYSATLCVGNDSSNAPSKCIALSGTGVATVAAPSAPVMISPGASSAPGQLISTTTPVFMWNGSATASYYNIYISQPPYGSAALIYTSPNLSAGTTSFPIPSGVLQTGIPYRWNMSATNSAGTTFALRGYERHYQSDGLRGGAAEPDRLLNASDVDG
jgi:pimeloyl-ACP methyl ester carboxylesterase